MSFKWSCFIVPLRLEICSFIAILVCISLFYSIYVQYIYIYIYIEYVYGFMRIIVLSVCITCGSSYVSFQRSQYHVLTLRFY